MYDDPAPMARAIAPTSLTYQHRKNPHSRMAAALSMDLQFPTPSCQYYCSTVQTQTQFLSRKLTLGCSFASPSANSFESTTYKYLFRRSGSGGASLSFSEVRIIIFASRVICSESDIPRAKPKRRARHGCVLVSCFARPASEVSKNLTAQGV